MDRKNGILAVQWSLRWPCVCRRGREGVVNGCVVRMNLQVLSSLIDTLSFLVIALQRPDLEAFTALINSERHLALRSNIFCLGLCWRWWVVRSCLEREADIMVR